MNRDDYIDYGNYDDFCDKSEIFLKKLENGEIDAKKFLLKLWHELDSDITDWYAEDYMDKYFPFEILYHCYLDGKLVKTYDSKKEYEKWLDYQLMENLDRNPKVVYECKYIDDDDDEDDNDDDED